MSLNIEGGIKGMKNLKMLKGGTILLVIVLVVGVFALIVWANGNGLNGMRGGLNGNMVTPGYGMQNKGVSNQMQSQDCENCAEGLGNGIVRRADAPDDDGDGIPNGQDPDYESVCDDECDGICDSEPKSSGMRRNALGNENDGISEYLVHINGGDLKTMKISDIAQLWGIDADSLLSEIIRVFGLEKSYNIGNSIDDLSGEYRFFPYQIKEIAERIKAAPVE